MRRLLWLLLFVGPLLCAQDAVFPTVDFRSRALGGTGLTADGVEAIWNNPAGLAGAHMLSAAATTEQRFGLREFSIHSGAAVFPGGFGLQLASFTYAGLGEQRIGIAYGRRLSDRLSLGAELVGFVARAPGREAVFLLSPGLGLRGRLTKRLAVGLRVMNLIGGDLPQQWSAGGSYRPADHLRINLEASYSAGYPVSVRAGVEYRVGEGVILRTGASSGPAALSFGASYRVWERLEVGLTASYHQQLGVSPLAGFIWHPGPVK